MAKSGRKSRNNVTRKPAGKMPGISPVTGNASAKDPESPEGTKQGVKVDASRRRTGTVGAITRERGAADDPKADALLKEYTGDPRQSNGDENGNGNGKVRYRSLVINGTKYRTRLNQKFEKRKTYRNPDPKKIASAIPGTVIKICVEEGQEVKAGEQMLILEAMKMKNRIVFHTGGTVKALHVREGEKIPKDYLMLELA
jgi:biotin carboxyl carrier protein